MREYIITYIDHDGKTNCLFSPTLQGAQSLADEVQARGYLGVAIYRQVKGI